MSCGCGLEGGAEACHSLFRELTAREFSDYRYGRFHRVTVDTYCLQHPDLYCVSAKSLMAHLGGLCCKFEHGSAPEVYSTLQRSLNGAPVLEKPGLPSFRGAVTIGEALAAPDAESYGRAVERWSRSVWNAHSELHGFAHHWLEQAIGASTRTAGAQSAAYAGPAPRR